MADDKPQWPIKGADGWLYFFPPEATASGKRRLNGKVRWETAKGSGMYDEVRFTLWEEKIDEWLPVLEEFKGQRVKMRGPVKPGTYTSGKTGEVVQYQEFVAIFEFWVQPLNRMAAKSEKANDKGADLGATEEQQAVLDALANDPAKAAKMRLWRDAHMAEVGGNFIAQLTMVQAEQVLQLFITPENRQQELFAKISTLYAELTKQGFATEANAIFATHAGATRVSLQLPELYATHQLQQLLNDLTVYAAKTTAPAATAYAAKTTAPAATVL